MFQTTSKPLAGQEFGASSFLLSASWLLTLRSEPWGALSNVLEQNFTSCSHCGLGSQPPPACCCCWKKAMMSIISLQHPSTCQSLHGGVGNIWKQSHLKQAVWRELGRMEEGRSARSPTEQSQATLCPHFSYSPAFPRGLFRPICPTVIPSPAPGPWRNASIPLLCSSAFWVPPGPYPRCTNLPSSWRMACSQAV